MDKRSRVTQPAGTRSGTRFAKLFLLAFGLCQGSLAWAGLGASVTLQTGQPSNIQPSQTTVLEITLSNNNSTAPITAVAFNNSLPGVLPDGLKVSGAATYTCFDPATSSTNAGAGTLTAAMGTQPIQLVGGSIPARHAASSTDGSCTIRIPVTAGSADGTGNAYTYTIAAGAVTGNDGAVVANVGSVSQSVNVTAIARPTITKSFSNGTAVLGGAVRTLTLTVTNSNSIPITGFSITDNFPVLGGGGAIIKVATPPNATMSCNNAGAAPTFVPVADATGVSAGGTIPARSAGTDGTCTMTVDVVAVHTNGAYSTGAQTNTIDRATDFSNDIGIRADQHATANITVNSPLGVTKAFAPSSLADGQTGVVTITLSNAGDTDLTVTTFDDSPIDGVGNADGSKGLLVTGVATTCAGGTASVLQVSAIDRGVRLTGGTIPHGGSCTVTANFTATTQTANTPVTYTNAIAAGAVGVTAPGIVSQARTATILVADTLRVQKTSSTTSPRPGNPVRYAITVQNWSNADMNNVAIADPLTNGRTFLTGIINGLDFTPTMTGTGCVGLAVTSVTGNPNANFVISTVPQRTNVSTPGECVVNFYAMTTTDTATDGTSTVNSLPIGSVCTNNGAGVCNGGAASSTNSAVNTSVLAAAKSFSPAGPLNEGTVARMTITLSNFSANPLSNVSISDTLPVAGSVQMQVANPANAVTTCGAGTITATAGGTSVALNGGTVPARAGSAGTLATGAAGSCVLQVDIVGAAGTYSNTANAAGTETYANNTTHLVGPVPANASLTYNSVLSATKSFAPGTVSSGGRSTVTVRMSNSGSSALTNIRVIDPLPVGMVLASPTNAYSTCDGSPSVTGAAGANSITLNGARIAGGGSCDFLFDVIATGAANWVNTIPPGNILAQDSGVTNQSPVSSTLNYTAGNNIVVAKATNPSTLTFPGQSSLLTITLSAGATAVTGLNLTDHFTVNGFFGSTPNGMIVASNPQASTTCPAGTVTAAAGASSVSLSGATLAANASCTITLNVTSTKVGGITNYIPVGAIVTHQGLSNTLQATTSLTTQSNLGVTKLFTPNVIKPNSRSRLRITFYNAGAQPASSLSVLDNLPVGLTVPTGPNPTTTCTGATVSTPTATSVQISGGNLAAASGGVAASCYAEIDVAAGAEGVYVNTIPVGALNATVSGVPTTNSDPATATVRAKQPLVIHKAIGGFTLDSGNPVGFTTGEATRSPGVSAPLVIHLSNPNADNLTNAAFVDNLPSGLVVATTPAAATTCAGGTVTAAVSATSIALSGATIPPTGSCTVTVNVLSNIAGSYTNNIASGAVTTLEGVSNEELTRARLIVTSPPGIGKQFSPPVIPPNGTSRLTITIDNTNSQSITLSSDLTDTLPTLPGQVSVATVPNVSTTCRNNADNAAAGIVNQSNAALAAGHIAVRLPSGSKVPPGGCSIAVDVTAATPGTHNNNIPAGALSTNLGTNQQPANAPLLVSTLGYISGKVFLETTPPLNGTYLAGTDTPLASVEIRLVAGATCGGAVLFTTHTDAQGNYLFPSLNAGTYSVCEPSQPAGTLNSFNQTGTIVAIGASTGTPGTASNPTATSSQIVGIVLGTDGGDVGRVSGSPNNNFSEVMPVSISGTVFKDENNNGTQQGADAGLASVSITLGGTDWMGNPVSQSTTTDAAGAYSFTSLPPGTYTVTEPAQPTNTSNGITTAGAAVTNGTAGTATSVTTLPSRISGVVLPPGTQSVDNNFAEIANGRSVFGRVYRDDNDNGLFDGAETGIAGQTIQLTGIDVNGNTVSLSTTTAADGTFAFTSVPESNGAGYTLTQPAQPASTISGRTTPGTTGGTGTPKTTTPSTIVALNLSGANTVSADNLFGEIYVPPVANIPTLSEWGLILLSALMALFGLRQTRRNFPVGV